MPTLDGWRAVAITMVILCHDKLHRAGPFSTQWFRLMGGRAGVDLFFALSGLLICSRLLQEEKLRGRISLKGFYIRRLFRIQPASLTFLAAVSVLMLTGVIERLPKDILACVLLVRNYLPRFSGPDSYYVGHFWSLSVEEHFYLLFPTFLLLVRRRRALVLGIVAAAVEIWRVIFLTHRNLYFGAFPDLHTDVSAGPIALAAMVAVLLLDENFRRACVRWLRPWLVLPVAACVWAGISVHYGRLDHAVFILTLPALLVSTMLHPESWTGRVLEWAPLRFVGHISYSLYLWQMLFFTYLTVLPTPAWHALVVVQHTPLRYPVLLALACASFYLVEKPLIKLGHKLARPATPGREDLDETAAPVARNQAYS